MDCKLKFEVEGCEIVVEKKDGVIHIEACKGEEVLKEMEVDLASLDETEQEETDVDVDVDSEETDVDSEEIEVEESVKTWKTFFNK